MTGNIAYMNSSQESDQDGPFAPSRTVGTGTHDWTRKRLGSTSHQLVKRPNPTQRLSNQTSRAQLSAALSVCARVSVSDVSAMSMIGASAGLTLA